MVKLNWEPQHVYVIQIPVLIRCVMKGQSHATDMKQNHQGIFTFSKQD